MGDFVHESGSVACFIGNLRMPLEFTSGTQTEIEMPRVPNKKKKPNHPSHEKVGFGELRYHSTARVSVAQRMMLRAI